MPSMLDITNVAAKLHAACPSAKALTISEYEDLLLQARRVRHYSEVECNQALTHVQQESATKAGKKLNEYLERFGCEWGQHFGLNVNIATVPPRSIVCEAIDCL